MKFNKWTMGLAAVGVVSLASAARADEQKSPMSQVQTAVSGTTLSGYVDASAHWNLGSKTVERLDYTPSAYRRTTGDGFNLNSVDLPSTSRWTKARGLPAIMLNLMAWHRMRRGHSEYGDSPGLFRVAHAGGQQWD